MADGPDLVGDVLHTVCNYLICGNSRLQPQCVSYDNLEFLLQMSTFFSDLATSPAANFLFGSSWY